ncbi:MAG: tetratricopeptide repeat protein [Planctomycetes bacterium]|nr:tetratricopeptide repeat protein [Planctomycetota bacterium]MCW8136370.1 tetratricopeptide repeat protein [Planctomycetota bacterium]
MRRILAVCLLLPVLLPAIIAQPAPETPEPPKVTAQEYADRSRRLREFGYPELARAQLDKGAAAYPTEKPIVLEQIRLLTETRARYDDVMRWVGVYHQLYAADYDISYAVAQFLEVNERRPVPPDFEDERQLAGALNRLETEMAIYRELGAFIAKPGDKLPEAAKGKPDMPLCYLARCALAKPGSHEVLEFTASYLDKLACSFHGWAMMDRRMRPFGHAAAQLFELAIPLYEGLEADQRSTAYVRQRLSEIYFRLAKFEKAREWILRLDLVSPNGGTAARVLQHIAQATSDHDLLVEAMERQSRVWRSPTAQLNVLAARRMRQHKWPFATWTAWQLTQDLYLAPHERADAILTLIEDKPEFLEAHFADAALRVEVAQDAPPEDRRKLLQGALAVLEKCKDIAPSFADWHSQRANVLWQLGDFKESAKAYRELARLDPSDPEAPRFADAATEIAEGKYTSTDYALYREVLDTEGDFKAKARTLEVLCSRSPKFRQAHALLSRLALMLKRFDVAIGAATAALELDPDQLEVRDNLAWASMRLSRWAAAAEHFKNIAAKNRNYRDAARWASLTEWVASANADAQRGAAKWLEAQDKDLQPTARTRLLEDAAVLAPDFPEALVDLAMDKMRIADFQAAESILDRALAKPRDNWARAAVHMARGRLFIAGRRTERAVAEFESSFAADRSDGGALLLAAIALHGANENASASAAMRKLFTEVPGTPLLRPTPEEVNLLDILPVQSEGARALHPAYDAGTKMAFGVEITVSGEGKGVNADNLRIAFDMAVEVLEVPGHGGVWKLKLTFSGAPDGFGALNGAGTVLTISPWFGMCEEPQVTVFQNVVNPALQALTEGFTLGLGDAPLAQPYVWKNTLTKGPPHFGQGDAEGACLHKLEGDAFTVLRRAMAGRQIGAHDAAHSRVLEAKVEAGGPRRALRRVSFEIAKHELAPDREDVIRSHLLVTVTAR